MKVAEILSDLTSLRVCVMHFQSRPVALLIKLQEHEAAMALVSCRPSGEGQSSSNKLGSAKTNSTAAPSRTLSGLEGDGDPDLQRAMDLVDLHYGVKEKYSQGKDMSLEAARAEVHKVLQDIRHKR